MPWTCSRGQTYSDWELEMGMLESTAQAIMEEQRREYELAADLDHELRLARDHLDGDEVPWPWYADPPSIVEQPQVFEP